MNEPINRETDDLAKVLNRLNTLTQSTEISVAESPDEDIPVLSDVYQGEGAQMKPESFLPQALAEPVHVAPGVDLAELLQEIRPLLQVAIRQIVREELANHAEVLSSRVEGEIETILSRYLRNTDAGH